MRYVEVEGAKISVIGLGAWQFGSFEWGYGNAYAQGPALEITRRALDLGVNLIDSAEIYGFGRSERIVGEAIVGRREQAFVATKLLPVTPLPPVIEWRARESARRLGVEQMDLYQLHFPNPLVPLPVQMQGMRAVQDSGLARYVGVSNYSKDQWEAAERALDRPVLSNQVSYSLAAREPDREIVPYARDKGRLVIAYSPLAQGFLSGRYDASNPPSGATRAGNPLFTAANLEAGRELIAVLRKVAERHGVTPAQVALAWVIRRPNTVAIPGASSVAQLEANVAAADLQLSNDDDAELTAASDGFKPRGGLSALPGMLTTRLRR